MGEVVWLGRYPVKSMRGEELPEVQLGASGVDGDRRYALVDEETGLIASAKNPRKWRTLLAMLARHGRDGRLSIRCPDGSTLRVGDADLDARLSEAAGRPVHLTSTRPDGAAMERLTPPTEPGAGALTRSTLSAGTPGDTFVDFAAVHVVTTATLDALGPADARRFRPNIVVRMADPAPFAENAWLDRILTVGDRAEVRVVAPTPRCSVPTLAQGDDLPDDPEVLRRAARANRIPVLDYGTLTCVGAYAAVERGGRLRVGDPVRVTA